MKVLIPFNGSPEAYSALGWAKKLGATSATVLDVSSGFIGRGGRDRRGRVSESGGRPGYATRAELEEAAETLTAAGVPATSRAERGSLPKTVVRLAEAEGFDLILMGLPKRNPIMVFLFGSPGLSIAKRSAVPTVLVPPASSASAALDPRPAPAPHEPRA